MRLLEFLRATSVGLACTALACGTSASAPKAPLTSRHVAGAPEPACPSGARWLGADPHVPLAVTAHERFLDLRDNACCSLWARRGERWHALDAWGRVVGIAEVVDWSRNDITECNELTLRTVSGAPGVGMYASTDVPSGRSFQWSPSDAERASFGQFMAHADEIFRPLSNGTLQPWPTRARFFFAPPKEGSSPIRFALVGGAVLLIARLDDGWRLDHVSNQPPGFAEEFVPVAVLDMDGDGSPEVVYRQEGGGMAEESVLRMNTRVPGWTPASMSVGTITI